MKQKNIELDCLILASIVNSDETYEDILSMATRFLSLRFPCEYNFPFDIQNPPSETKKK